MMMRERTATRRATDGFTLIEVLIVVVLLGILAAVVVFAVGNLSGTAATNACKTEASSFMTAVQGWKTSTSAAPGVWPDSAGTKAQDVATYLALPANGALLGNRGALGSADSNTPPAVPAAGKWNYNPSTGAQLLSC